MPLWAFWLAFSTVIATLGIRWWFHYEEHGRTVTNFLYGEGYNLLDAQNIIPILAYFVFLGFLNPTNYNWVVPGGWSIQTEIYHYTLFPFMRKAGMTFSLCVLFIIQILFILFTFGKQPSPELAILSAYVVGPIFFVLGMLTSQAFKFIQTKEELFKVKIIDWILMVSILVVSCFIKINPNSSINTPKTITVIVVSIIASFVIYKLNIIKKLTSSVGKYSYGMYFSHFLIMPLIAYPIVNYLFIEANNEKINTSVAILSLIPIFLISVLGSYLVALVTYNMLEKHVINWSKKF